MEARGANGKCKNGRGSSFKKRKRKRVLNPLRNELGSPEIANFLLGVDSRS